MGIVIEATSMVKGREYQGSIELAVKAANDCIKIAGIEKQDIGILINIGLYREDNIVEPAIASLIQKQIGINIDPIKEYSAENATFCFDLSNGSCGFLNAVQIMQSLFNNRKIKYGLIVSSDVHPSKSFVDDFIYSHYGAAVILENSSNENAGFKNILMRTSSDKGIVGVNGYLNLLSSGTEGRKQVIIEIDDDYYQRLQSLVIDTIKEYLSDKKIDISNVKLIIAEPAKEFGINVAKDVGINEKSVIKLYEKVGNPNTSALSIGYYFLTQEYNLKEGDQILFVGASSGLTSGCCLYIV